MTINVLSNNNVIGTLITNRSSITNEEICTLTGINLAVTEDDYNNMPNNKKYDIESLTFIRN